MTNITVTETNGVVTSNNLLITSLIATLEATTGGGAGMTANATYAFLSSVVSYINLSTTFVTQLNDLAAKGWKLQYVAGGGDVTNVNPGSQNKTIVIQDITSGPGFDINTGTPVPATFSGPAVFAGALSHEVGHAEDIENNTVNYTPTTAAAPGENALSVGAEVALHLLSEGKAQLNSVLIAQQISSASSGASAISVEGSQTAIKAQILDGANYTQAIIDGADSYLTLKPTGQTITYLTQFWNNASSNFNAVASSLSINSTVNTDLSLVNSNIGNVNSLTLAQGTNVGTAKGTDSISLTFNSSSPLASYIDVFGNYSSGSGSAGRISQSGTAGGQGSPQPVSTSPATATTYEIFNLSGGTSLLDIYNPAVDYAQQGSGSGSSSPQSLTGIAEEVFTASSKNTAIVNTSGTASISGTVSNVTYYTAANASSVITVASTTTPTSLANDTVMFDGNAIAGNIPASGYDQDKRHYALSGTTLTITGTGGSKDTLTIDNFAEGDFGVEIPYTVSSIPEPLGFDSTVAIDNNGTIVGSTGIIGSAKIFTDSNGAITTSQPNYTFPAPISESVILFFPDGINDSGTIVMNGWYDAPEGIETAGFVDSGGTVSEIIDPNAASIMLSGSNGVSETYVSGINDSGVIVGSYIDPAGLEHGYTDSGGKFTTINEPNAPSEYGTQLTGINDSGVIVGNYTVASGVPYGFMDNSGKFTTISNPNAGSGGTDVTGINNNGVIVGRYVDTSGLTHEFTYDNGVYADIDTSSTAAINVTGISGSGELVGTSATAYVSASDQTPSAPTQSTTESNSSSTVPANTDSGTYGNSNTVTTGNGDNASVYGNSNTVDTGTNGSVSTSGANNTVNAGADILALVSASSTWAVTNLSGNNSSAEDSGTYSTINLNDNSDSATMNGNLGSTQINGGSESVAVTGNNDNVYDNGTGGSNVTIGSYSNSVYLYANGSSSTDNGTYNYIELDGNSDTATLNGNSGDGDIYGSSDTITVRGSNNTGSDEGSGGNTIYLEGNTDHGNMFDNGSTCIDSGTDDTVQLSGNGLIADLEGTGGAGTIYGTDDTINVTGINNLAFDLSTPSGANTLSLQGSGNSGIIYNTGADTVTLGGSSNSLSFESGAGSGSTAISGTNETVTIAGTSAEKITFDSNALGKLLLQDAQGFSGTLAGLADGDSIDLTNFQFSNGATISKVTGTGAAGTTTDITITDGAIATQLLLLNQYAAQFTNNASAYTLTADSTAGNAGTLFQLAAAH